MENEIEHLRGELSILSELEMGTNVKGKMCRKLNRKYNWKKENRAGVKEPVKRRMQLKSQRMQVYEKRRKFCCPSLIFKNDTKKLFREIRKEKITINETPAINAIERFFGKIWSGEKHFNEKAE